MHRHVGGILLDILSMTHDVGASSLVIGASVQKSKRQ